MALLKGELDDAEFLLEGVKPGEGDIDDLDFLHGTIALARGDWQAAIARFRAMLARNPNLPRVRLDLAFAYFQAGEDRRAAYHFRLALGDKDLPPVVRARPSRFSTASGGASRGPSAARWPLPPIPTSTRRPAPARWPCSGRRAGFRTTRAKPAAWG